jgi:hypothetical protein
VDDADIRQSGALRALRFVPLGFMAAMVLVTYAAIGWTLRRGFGWGDESFVYTLIASNRQAIGEAWGFQHLLHPLYVLTGESVLAFRVLRLAGYVLLSVALVWAARFVMHRIGITIPRSGWAFMGGNEGSLCAEAIELLGRKESARSKVRVESHRRVAL